MQKTRRFWMIVGIVILISMVGTSAASARTQAGQEEVSFSAVSFGDLETPQMVLEYNLNALGSNDYNQGCYQPGNCSKWTGRWLITYLRKSEGHWVTLCELYVPEFIDNDLDAKKWTWSPEYIAENCSLPGEAQTWEGTIINFRKETVPVPCRMVCPA